MVLYGGNIGIRCTVYPRCYPIHLPRGSDAAGADHRNPMVQ